MALSLSNDPYVYILLIPAISAFFLYSEWPKVIGSAAPQAREYSGIFAAILAVALIMYGLLALSFVKPPAEYVLSLKVACVLLVWTAAFAFCYGTRALRVASFPLLLLLLMVPIPSNLMDKIIAGLQWGSAGATEGLFRLGGVPMFRVGVRFDLPGVSIEIAKECSSIHSGSALFISGLLMGHLFLRSLPARVVLTLLTLPLAMLTNAVRITTLWYLATRVDMGFLHGDLHHKGGIVFSVVSLSLLMGSLWLLRKLEGGGYVWDGLRPARND